MSNWNPTAFIPNPEYIEYKGNNRFPVECPTELDALFDEQALIAEILLPLFGPTRWQAYNLTGRGKYFLPMITGCAIMNDVIIDHQMGGYWHEFTGPEKLRLTSNNVFFEPKEIMQGRKMESVDLEDARFTGAIILTATLQEDGTFYDSAVHPKLVVSIDGKLPTYETFDNYVCRPVYYW